MAIEANLETNPLDNIRPGVTFFVEEGQLIMRSPILIQDGGELFLDDNAHLMFWE